jgi:HD-GYP domain-containing protein (c-di-GMP phosphodiesterase class II)
VAGRLHDIGTVRVSQEILVKPGKYGTGYPSLVYRRDCHLASRLVHVVDIYDALCAHCRYRDALSPEAALRIVEEQSGASVELPAEIMTR